MEEPDGTAVCLETLAWQAAQAGRSVRAAWLLGAADAYWRQDLALMWGIESLIACHHEALDRVTSALGETRAHNLMRRGRALKPPRRWSWPPPTASTRRLPRRGWARGARVRPPGAAASACSPAGSGRWPGWWPRG